MIIDDGRLGVIRADDDDDVDDDDTTSEEAFFNTGGWQGAEGIGIDEDFFSSTLFMFILMFILELETRAEGGAIADIILGEMMSNVSYRYVYCCCWRRYFK